jgi:hypothetical protein
MLKDKLKITISKDARIRLLCSYKSRRAPSMMLGITPRLEDFARVVREKLVRVLIAHTLHGERANAGTMVHVTTLDHAVSEDAILPFRAVLLILTPIRVIRPLKYRLVSFFLGQPFIGPRGAGLGFATGLAVTASVATIWAFSGAGFFAYAARPRDMAGVAENYTNLLAFYILKPNGEVIVRKDVWAIPTNQMLDDSMKEHLADFNAHIRTKIGDHLEEIDPILADQEPIPDFLFEDEVLDEPDEPEAAAEEADKQSTPEAYDQWLTVKVLLERGGPPESATVIGRKRDHDGVKTDKSCY